MTSWRWVPRACALLAVACSAKAQPRAPEPPRETVAAPQSFVHTDSLSRVFAVLEHQLAPIQSWRTNAEATLRKDSGTARADTLLLQHRDALQATIRRLEHTFATRELHEIVYPPHGWNERIPPAQQQARSDSVVSFIAARAVWPRMGEGVIDFEVSAARLLAWLGRFTTPAMQDFLRMQALQQSAPVASDAALLITADQLAERMRDAELYLAKYPSSAAHPHVLWLYRVYLAMYLAGIDNSPVFDLATGRLLLEMRKSYERYAAAHAQTESGRAVTEYLRLLKASGYRRNGKVDDYLRRLWEAVPPVSE